ncbi:uncharacterized protein LOC131210935 [Anopheles bellator]|uniref:uncharacterized protein LOC131210935 n=1 Tax=Anopheles bellator TaxID=139047 RepID=UPI00264A1BBE|nr:uncharacterized protein LOC131210935 [Anopheles bellator]
MGNCLKGCLSKDTNSGERRLNVSDSQYEVLIDGIQCADGRSETDDLQGAITRKANGKAKFFRKFWTRSTTGVDYARLNRARNNNFSQRASSSTTAAGSSGNAYRHNHHPAAGFDIQLQCLDAHSLLLVAKDGQRKPNTNGYSDLQTDQTSTPGSSLDLEWENDYGYQNGSQWLTQQDDPLGTAQLVSFPVAVQESVFKIEEWSLVKKSKDRINALRRLDPNGHPASHPHRGFSTATDSEGVAGSLECLRAHAGGGRSGRGPSVEHRLSLTSADRTADFGGSSDLSHISSTPDGSLEWDIDQDRQLKSDNESLDLETKELLLEIEQLKNRVLNETGATLKDDSTLS